MKKCIQICEGALRSVNNVFKLEVMCIFNWPLGFFSVINRNVNFFMSNVTKTLRAATGSQTLFFFL